LVSSNDLGLCYFDVETSKFTRVGVELGINNVHVKAIFEDAKSIWIVSEQKIIRTNENFDFQSTYTMNDGLHFGIEHLAATISPNPKRLYFGGQEGVQFINIKNEISDSTINKVIIIDFKIFEKSVSPQSKILKGKSISYTDSVILDHKENFITIDFSQMHYSDQIKSYYSYMLEGVNSEWITVPYSRNSVTYSNLSHGEYTFMIKASNIHGEIDDTITFYGAILNLGR